MGKRSRNTGNREERNLVAYPFTAGVVYHEGLVHPAAAILLLIAVSFSKPISTGLRKFTLVLLLVAIAADLVLAVLIGLGVVKGDWFLPLVFAVVPVVGVAYLAGGGRQDHPRSA